MFHYARRQSANSHMQSPGSIAVALIAVAVAEERDVADEATVEGFNALIGMIVPTTLARGKRYGARPCCVNDTDAM